MTLEWKETLVNILFALERHKKALPWIRELAQKSSGDKKKKWQEILLYQYLTLKMDAQALEYARFLTRTDPTEPKWWKSLAHIHLGKNRLEKGLQSLMIYGFLTPLSLSETQLLADLYMACNVPEEAARYYQEWVAMAGKETGKDTGKPCDRAKVLKTISKIANALVRAGQDDAALAWMDKGLSMKKDYSLMRAKADLLFRQRRYEIAYDVYAGLTDSKKDKGLAHLMMGYAAWHCGKNREAAQAFARAADHPKQKKAAQSALAQIEKTADQQVFAGGS